MRFDVSYGRHHGERLDVFLPTASGRAPVHVFIHGGYWHRLDKADFSFVARAFPEAVAGGVHYALGPRVDLHELVPQGRASHPWGDPQCAPFGGDPGGTTGSRPSPRA